MNITEEEQKANLSELERKLNREMKCPAGMNQVFLRSLLMIVGTLITLGLRYAERRLEKHDEAILSCTKAIELNPAYNFAYNGRGLAYSDKGDYDRAIAEYNKSIELNPSYSDAYFNRGIAFSAKGDYERAIADYSKVIESNPEDAEAYYLRGVAYGLAATVPAAAAAVLQATITIFTLHSSTSHRVI